MENIEKLIIKEKTFEGILLLKLNRPEKRNAINSQMIEQIIAELEEIKEDRTIGCVVLTGSGSVFTAGRDLKDIKDKNTNSLDKNREEYRTLKKLSMTFNSCPVPIVVGIEGYALGLAAGIVNWCDYAVMGHSAKYGYPEAGFGFLPGLSSLQLKKEVPKKLSFDLLINGRSIEAEEAQRHPIVNQVVPDNHVLDTCMTVATQLTMHGPIKSRLMKQFHQNLFVEKSELEMEYSLEMMALSSVLSKEEKERTSIKEGLK